MARYIYGFMGKISIDADSDDAADAQLNAMATEDLLAALDCEVVDVIDDDEIQRIREEATVWQQVAQTGKLRRVNAEQK